MTDVMKDFDFNGADATQLMARYELLREKAIAEGDNVDTLILREMVAICQVLRRRSGGPPKRARPKAMPTIDDL